MSTSEINPPTGNASRAARSRFESVYRENVTAIAAYFARRSTDPQTVADLTSETFVQAIRSLSTYQGRGSLRAWLFGIARTIYAQHQTQLADGRSAVNRLAGQLPIGGDDIDDLVDRIDAERAGRELLKRLADLPELERSAIELVDITGMSPRSAARALGISPGAMRVRLFRARARLRKEQI